MNDGKSESSLETTDRLSREGGAGAPRISLESMEEKIESESYEVIDGVLTLCIIRTANGSHLVGKSAPASPENFNVELGKKFAREDALRQLRPLESYALRDWLSAGLALWGDRRTARSRH